MCTLEIRNFAEIHTCNLINLLTPGMSPAALANIITNEGAILAVRNDRKIDIEESLSGEEVDCGYSSSRQIYLYLKYRETYLSLSSNEMNEYMWTYIMLYVMGIVAGKTVSRISCISSN